MLKSLAEIVIEESLTTAEAVGRAAEVSDKKGTPLVVSLVRECGIDEVALVAALRRHVRVSLADPAKTIVDPDALRLISRDACRRLRVVPLSVSAHGSKNLRVAAADPTDTVALAEVEHLTGHHVDASLMTLSAVEELIEKAYRHMVTEVMSRGSVAKPSTMPFHRVSEEADANLRHEALITVLVEKKLITKEEYEAEVRKLMKERAGRR